MGTEMESGKVLRVARTELRIGLRRFAFWFMALIFAAIGGFFFTRFMAVSSGEDSLTQGVKLARNAPYSLAVLMAFLALLFVHFTAALTVDPVLRDRRIGLLPLVLSSPIEGSRYVFGKFLGALALALLAPLSFVLVAGIVQFVPNSAVGLVPPNAAGLLVAYLEFYVPFVLTVAALAFSIAIWTGSPKLVYALVTVLFIAYMVMFSLVDEVSYRWVAFLDPTGILFLDEVSKGRTNAELNALGWFLDRGFLLNRAILLAVGIGTLGVFARGFARREARVGSTRRAALAGPALSKPAPLPSSAEGALAPLRPLDPGIRLAIGELRQLGRVAATELRLLSHERSLFFLVPLLAFVLWISMTTSTGPFEAEPIPVSSQVARDALWMMVMFLFGTTIFFVGETAFRDREEGLADLLHTYPVPESALLGGKVLSNLVLSLMLVAVGILTAIVYQLTHGGGALDPKPFITMYGGILVPTIFILITISLCLSFLSGSKPGGYALVLGVGGALVWAFIRGHRHWLYNLPAVNLFSYSDIVGLGPLRAVITLQRFYVLALGFLLFWIAVALYPRRTAGNGRFGHLGRTIAGRRVLLPGLTSLAAALVLGGTLHAKIENGMGSLASERLQVEYEKSFKAWLDGQREPELAAVDLELDLEPPRHAFTVRGEFLLRNPLEAPIDSVHITVNPRLLAGGKMLLGGRPPDAFRVAVATYRLPEPLATGETTPLAFQWSGKVPDGVPRHSATLGTFITPGATFLHSFAPWPWIPVVGYYADIEIGSERIRRKYDLPAKESLPFDDGSGLTRGLAYLSAPFPYRARIRVPAGEQVLSAGSLVAERELADGRREYEFATDGDIYFYPVLAGRWVERSDGPSGVYHAPVHPQNAEKILDALVRSRETYSELFSPFPYQELRIAEFPRLTYSAMGYPTLIPFSEGIGFLTRDTEKRVNLNFYVTAHEVAHQWWGTVVWPAHAKGSPVLTEGLANYSTLLMAERFEGDERRQKLFEDMENRYLRERDANEERPLAIVDGDRRGDETLLYDRGGIVFYMLDRVLGEERMLAAIREYVDRFSFRNDHPTMTDFMAIYEELYPESAHFLDQFVRDKSIPNPHYRKVEKEEEGDGTWRVDFELANEGTGDLDLVVAATSGEEGEETWREARTVVALRGAAPVTGRIYCDFEPESIVMDPDRIVLLQERRRGVRKL